MRRPQPGASFQDNEITHGRKVRMSARERLDMRLARLHEEQPQDNWERGCNGAAMLFCAEYLFLTIGCILFGW
jgi:hypothetical protein